MPQLVIAYLLGQAGKERMYVWNVEDRAAEIPNPYQLPNHQFLAPYLQDHGIQARQMVELFPRHARCADPANTDWDRLSWRDQLWEKEDFQSVANLLGYPVAVYVGSHRDLRFQGDEQHQCPTFMYRLEPQSQPSPVAA